MAVSLSVPSCPSPFATTPVGLQQTDSTVDTTAEGGNKAKSHKQFVSLNPGSLSWVLSNSAACLSLVRQAGMTQLIFKLLQASHKAYPKAYHHQPLKSHKY
ncbi:hypothetical protein JZ751_012113 [Albula glossodonta]|uniref:Uncharacterized protein n=1 Tax=Albula glossodonta TaxID=121402 RepID=A0A8T2PRN8_9TELE|nr:hypothetical protein JZ751_012113 [Albula glossodonta]